MSTQPTITDSRGDREFACSPAAVVVFVINREEKFLMLSSPAKRNRKGTWETVSGALEAGETVLAGSLREAREEIGADVTLRPLGTVHTYTFHYDDRVQYMIGVCYLMAYQGGQVQPGDDMFGSQFRWWSLDEIREQSQYIAIPSTGTWVFERAIELYRLWKHQKIDKVQLGIEAS